MAYDGVLDGRNVLVLTTNHGTEQDELRKPVAVLRGAGARVTVAAQKNGAVRTVVSPQAVGKGVMVVMDDRILSAREVRKMYQRTGGFDGG